MDKQEFLEKVSQTKWIDADRYSRLALGAIIPASWCRDILKELPEAESYLRSAYPSQMAECDKAKQAG